MSKEKMRTKILIIVCVLLLQGCAAIATRENGETLKLVGIGSAKWPDGTIIESKPLIDFSEIEIQKED